MFCNATLFFSLFYLPWWFTAIIGVIFLFYFRNFYEIMAVGILADIIYGIPRKIFFDFELVNTIFAVMLYFAAGKFKKFLRRESVLFVK